MDINKTGKPERKSNETKSQFFKKTNKIINLLEVHKKKDKETRH